MGTKDMASIFFISLFASPLETTEIKALCWSLSKNISMSLFVGEPHKFMPNKTTKKEVGNNCLVIRTYFVTVRTQRFLSIFPRCFYIQKTTYIFLQTQDLW